MNPENKDEVIQLYLDDIIPNRFQPREVFDEKALKELAASIKAHGVIQPIIVRNVNGKYEIIAGERRYKASALAGMTRIPAIIRNLDDKESSKVALLENLQRKNLNPIEEARTYHKILELDEMTQEELAKTMGKSQSAVANKLRLLALSDEIQDALLKEQISERHARALLNVEDNDKQLELLKRIIAEKMTVRILEEEIDKLNTKESEIKDIKISNQILNDNILTPTTVSEKDEYGKISIVPPAGMDNVINYGEIDKDEINTSQIDERNNYYTTDVSHVDIDDLQNNSININSGNENMSKLDNMLNINNPFDIQNNQEKDYIDEKTMNQINKINEQTSLFSNNETNNKFKIEEQINSEGVLLKLKNTVKEYQDKGINIEMDEMDFGNSYQIIIKIEKN